MKLLMCYRLNWFAFGYTEDKSIIRLSFTICCRHHANTIDAKLGEKSLHSTHTASLVNLFNLCSNKCSFNNNHNNNNLVKRKWTKQQREVIRSWKTTFLCSCPVSCCCYCYFRFKNNFSMVSIVCFPFKYCKFMTHTRVT